MQRKDLHDMTKPILNPCIRIQSPYYYSKSHTYSLAFGECTQALEFKNSYHSSRKNQIDYTFISNGLKKLKSIKLLELDFQHITQFNILDFANKTIKNFRSLKTLKINIHLMKSFRIQTGQEFTQALKCLHEIRELHLSISTYQDGFDLVSSHLIREISRMSELEVLSINFGGTLLPFDAFEYFLNPIFTLSKLKSFDLELLRFEISDLEESSFFSKSFKHNTMTDFRFNISSLITLNDNVLSVFEHVISFFKNLKKINLHFQSTFLFEDLSEFSYIAIFEGLAQNKNLEHIEIAFGAFNFELSKSIDKLFTLIKNCALSLKVLRLDSYAKIGSARLMELIQITNDLFLEELSLKFTGFEENHLEKLLSKPSSTNLKALTISACLEKGFSINLDSCKMLLSNITEFSLILTKISIQDSEIRKLIEIFTCLDSIRTFSLFLDNIKFTDLLYSRLFDNIKSFHLLEKLSLSFKVHNLDYKIVKGLCESIKNLKKLKSIRFHVDFKLYFYLEDFLNMLKELPELSSISLPVSKFMRDDNHIVLLKNFLVNHKSIKVFEIENKCLNDFDINSY